MLSRRKKPKQMKCPACGCKMKRKGSFNRKYWKCPNCKTKVLKDGTVIEPPIEDKDMRDFAVKLSRKIEAKRKLIKRLKKKKYIPKVCEWDGEVINLDEYDSEGRPIKKEKKKKIKVKEGESEDVS